MNKETLEAIILEQQEDFNELMASDFCARREEPLVNLESHLAQVIIGVRRSGKSTLCINVLRQAKVNCAYINFDDERLEDIRTEDLNTILECLYKVYGDFDHLFIDEIQNVDSWFLFVNRLLRRGMHVLITGSNAKLLSGELATHLTGRHINTELYPFSFLEFCNYKKYSVKHGTTKEKGLLQKAFDEYLHEGGFPELQEEPRKEKYIRTLVENILTNDIEKRYKIKYKAAFEQIAQHLLNIAPAKVNYKDLMTQFGLKSQHTAENYVQYLKNAYLICGLHKYSTKSKIRVRDVKAYVVDVALMNNRANAFAGENLGWRLETIIYIELLCRCEPDGCDVYYYENSTSEADFVVCQGKTVKQIIQVSYNISNPKTYNREIKGLLHASEVMGCDNLLLINMYDTKQVKVDTKTIKIVPAYAWLVE